MIKGNVIIFGYGDVLVAPSYLGYVSFTNITPPLEPGETVTENIYKDLEIGLNVRIWEDNTHEIYDLMKTVNENNKVIKYKDYILDFSNYNEESVQVVKDAAYKTINPLCLAC